MYYLQEQSSTDFFILFRKTNEKYDSVVDPYSRVSKAAFPDPPQLLRMQMKCISGGCGSPGQAGAGPHVSANTFKQIAVKGGNGNITSHPHYRSLINGCKVRRQAAVCTVKVHSGTREGSSHLLVMLSEPGAKGAWRCVSCQLKHAKISVSSRSSCRGLVNFSGCVCLGTMMFALRVLQEAACLQFCKG